MKLSLNLSIGLLLLFIFSGCNRQVLQQQIEKEEIYQEAFSGFYLADAKTGEVLFQKNAEKLFTPASNTKILTLATSLAWLPKDSIPALAYQYEADTLRLWGLAYPQLATDDSPYNAHIQKTIAEWPGTVEVNLHGYVYLPRFGEGWMWDDYSYAFARERSGLPLYRNMMSLWRSERDTSRVPLPDGLAPNRSAFSSNIFDSKPSFIVAYPSERVRTGRVSRSENQNRYYANPNVSRSDTLFSPLFGTASMVTQLLEDWTGHTVRYHNKPLPTDWGIRTWKGDRRDTLLKKMMLPSDNFLAEQLLLAAGLYHSDLTQPNQIREKAQKEVLQLSSSELAWADASGISHYNLISPKALGEVLIGLYSAHGHQLFEALFPVGGQSGTIKNWYAGASASSPFVYAKTGTLRHNHSLSGLVRTKSGKHLIFSFMHNHFRGSSKAYKEAMESTLDVIYETY